MANDAPTEPATESAEDLARRFAALTAKWKQETLYSSKAKTIAAHPAYREVVAMGEKAVPLILADLEKEANHWFMALYEITGSRPVAKEDAGIVEKMAAAWIAWGRQQGYRW
jgi:hypothetical protein